MTAEKTLEKNVFYKLYEDFASLTNILQIFYECIFSNKTSNQDTTLDQGSPALEIEVLGEYF